MIWSKLYEIGRNYFFFRPGKGVHHTWKQSSSEIPGNGDQRDSDQKTQQTKGKSVNMLVFWNQALRESVIHHFSTDPQIMQI